MDPKSTTFKAFMAAATELGADVPEWVHLLPAGQLKTEDGRSGFTWDGGKVQLCSWDGRDAVTRVPVDVNHANSKQGPQGADTPAHGWIIELSVKDDGIWGRVDWNPSGKAMLANRSYRGISPELMVNAKTGLIEGIRGASLTNFPNLKGLVPILNSTTPQEHEEDMSKFFGALCAALALQATANEDAVLAAVNKLVADHTAATDHITKLCSAAGIAKDATFVVQLQAVSDLRDPTKVVPLSVVEGLRAELQTVTSQLNADRGSAAKLRAESFIDGEIKKGRVGLKPLRDHYVARHMTSAAEAANVEKEITGLPMMSGTSIIPSTQPQPGEVVLSEEDKHVAKLMGISEEAFKKTRAADAAATA